MMGSVMDDERPDDEHWMEEAITEARRAAETIADGRDAVAEISANLTGNGFAVQELCGHDFLLFSLKGRGF